MSKRDRKRKRKAITTVIRESKELSAKELKEMLETRLEKNFMKNSQQGAWTL